VRLWSAFTGHLYRRCVKLKVAKPRRRRSDGLDCAQMARDAVALQCTLGAASASTARSILSRRRHSSASASATGSYGRSKRPILSASKERNSLKPLGPKGKSAAQPPPEIQGLWPIRPAIARLGRRRKSRCRERLTAHGRARDLSSRRQPYRPAGGRRPQSVDRHRADARHRRAWRPPEAPPPRYGFR
jgi:hypothetical protein